MSLTTPPTIPFLEGQILMNGSLTLHPTLILLLSSLALTITMSSMILGSLKDLETCRSQGLELAISLLWTLLGTDTSFMMCCMFQSIPRLFYPSANSGRVVCTSTFLRSTTAMETLFSRLKTPPFSSSATLLMTSYMSMINPQSIKPYISKKRRRTFHSTTSTSFPPFNRFLQPLRSMAPVPMSYSLVSPLQAQLSHRLQV